MGGIPLYMDAHCLNRFACSSAFASTSLFIVPPFSADAANSRHNPDWGGGDVFQNELPGLYGKPLIKEMDMLRCHLRLSQSHQPLNHNQTFGFLEDKPAFGSVTEFQRLPDQTMVLLGRSIIVW